MSSVPRLLGIAALVIAAVSCAKPQARMMPERTPLEVPPVPARVIEPALETSELPADLGAEPPASQQPARQVSRVPARAAGGPVRPDAPAADPAGPADTLPAADEPQLRTAQAADDGEAARKIRDTLARAARTLNTVDYGVLNVDGRAHYDTAKRFMEQAEEALRSRNYVYSLFLADKAETIARQLPGR